MYLQAIARMKNEAAASSLALGALAAQGQQSVIRETVRSLGDG